MRISADNTIGYAISAVFLNELNRIQAEQGDVVRNINQIATVDQISGSDTASLSWLTSVPAARPFLSERALNPLTGGRYEVRINKYESTITLPRSAFVSQISQGVQSKIEDLAREMVRYKVRLATEVFAQGTTLTTYDGQPLLSSGRGNLTSNALSLNSLQNAIAALMSFTADDGQNLRRQPTHLIVGPKLYMLARQLVNSTNLVTGENATVGATNPVAGLLRVLVAPDLVGAYDDYWFVCDMSGIRPVVAIERSDLPDELIVRADPNTSDAAFMRDEVLVGFTSRVGVAAGAWYAVYAGIL